MNKKKRNTYIATLNYTRIHFVLTIIDISNFYYNVLLINIYIYISFVN